MSRYSAHDNGGLPSREAFRAAYIDAMLAKRSEPDAPQWLADADEARVAKYVDGLLDQISTARRSVWITGSAAKGNPTLVAVADGFGIRTNDELRLVVGAQGPVAAEEEDDCPTVASESNEQADPDREEELHLYVDNDGDLYRGHTWPLMAVLARRMLDGTYDPERAVTSWRQVADIGARKYRREFAERGPYGSFGVFSPADRDAVALEMARRFEQQVKDGEVNLDRLAGETPSGASEGGRYGGEEYASLGEDDVRAVISEAQRLFSDGGRRVVGLRQNDGGYAIMFLDMHVPEAIGRGATPQAALDDARARDGTPYRRRVVLKPGAPLGAFGRLMDSLKTYGVTVEADDSTNQRLALHTTAPRYEVDGVIRIVKAGRYVDAVEEI